MSRPKTPDYDVPVWAPDANYPSSDKPWSATPTKVAHPGANSVGITPRTGTPAQVINKLLHDAYATDQAARDALLALFDFVGQSPALNWRKSETPGTCKYAAYSSYDRCWYLVGDNANVKKTPDFDTWSADSIVDAVASGEDCRHVAVRRDNGDVLVSTTSRYVFYVPFIGTEAKVDAVGASYSGETRIVYDHVRGSFLHARLLSDTISVRTTGLRTSSDGVLWDGLSDLPIALRDMAVSPVTGCIVCVGKSTLDGRIHLRKTNDAGATWTIRSVEPIVSFPDRVQIIACEDGSWLLHGTDTTTAHSEIWRSEDDALTWTRVSHISGAANALYSVGALGDLWLALSGDADDEIANIVYSVDRGLTWRHSGMSVFTTWGGLSIASGAGGFLVLASNDTFFSSRAGLPDLGVL